MNRSLIRAALCAYLCLTFACAAPSAWAQNAQLVVSLTPGANASQVARAAGTSAAQVISPINTMVVTVPATSAAQATKTLDATSGVQSVAADVPVHDLATANDQYLSLQWPLATMGSLASWDYGQGAGVTVGVVDTGVDYTHPDLAGQVLSTGWDFVDNDNDPMDENGHGTHVAGIIAAVANNSIGIAGQAPQAKILPVRVLDATGSGWLSNVAAGIVYATDHGAQIINLSLGSPSPSQDLQSALDYAKSKGVLVFCAAGNDSSSHLIYPAAYSECISVGATDQTDHLASFSDYGPGIDLTAPGVQVASTVPGGYEYMSGTSMASPEAAAVAAQVLGMGLTPTATVQTLEQTAADLGAPGYDTVFGYGRVNALAAVQRAQTELSEARSVANYTTPAAGQLVISGQLLTGWSQVTIRTSAGTLRVYATRANDPGVSFTSSDTQIVISGLTAAEGRLVQSVSVDSLLLAKTAAWMPLAPITLTSSAHNQITVTGSALDGAPWLNVRDSLGIWHHYVNPRFIGSGDAPASLWTATQIVVTDPALTGAVISEVEIGQSKTPTISPLIDQTMVVSVT